MAKSKKINNFNPANPSNGNNAGMKPPAAPEIEASVLGAMMIEKEAVPKALELLNRKVFTLHPIGLYMKQCFRYSNHLNPLIPLRFTKN